MSRIGKLPVAIPAGVTVEAKDSVITVKGPKGTLTQDYDAANITVKVEGAVATVTRANDDKEIRAKHGLYRALLQNMIIGVTDGYKKTLVVAGVGYKVAKQGNKVVLNVGYSHPVEIFETADVKLECPTATEIVVSCINKAVVGQYAATVRSIRKPEPYHGYGIHYSDEVIERKEGKTAGK
ncbi:MAG: 50S ribosomal protein L6 [Clostridia bacterium]|nr:50S ribosomal protein L6 [Clostridia bacterium]